MECPKCGHGERRVVDSRHSKGTVRRRSECLSCKFRFTTKEVVVGAVEEVNGLLPEWDHAAYDNDGILIAPPTTNSRRLYG